MTRETAFKIAGEVADLGIDCNVSIAAAHPSVEIREHCMVHIPPTTSMAGQFVTLVSIAEDYGADLQFGNRELVINDVPIQVRGV